MPSPTVLRGLTLLELDSIFYTEFRLQKSDRVPNGLRLQRKQHYALSQSIGQQRYLSDLLMFYHDTFS